jgi:hypothetical protein
MKTLLFFALACTLGAQTQLLQAPLPDNAGVFTGANLATLNANVAIANANAAGAFKNALLATTADAICALGGDTSITGITCQATSATSATAFTTTVTIPAGTLAGSVLPFSFAFGSVDSSSPPSLMITVKLGSTPILTGPSALMPTSVMSGNGVYCQIVAPSAASASAPVIASCSATPFAPSSLRNALITPTTPSVAVATNAAQVLSITFTFSAATAGNAVWLQSINSIGH